MTDRAVDPKPWLKAVAARLDVSPTRPYVLGGRGGGGKLSTRLLEPLEVNVALLRSGHVTVVLVSCDLLYPGEAIRRAVENCFPDLPPEQIWVFASHTHNAPMTEATLPGLGEFQSDYVDDLVERLAPELAELLADLDAAPLALPWIATGKADHSVHRRAAVRGRVVMAPDAAGSRDETITAVVVESSAGKPVFALWNYACHPVALKDSSAVAAHYPHVVREALRDLLGAHDLPALFLQGFSGDTRPSASAAPSNVRDVLRNRVLGRRFHNMTWNGYQAWACSLARSVCRITSNRTPLPSAGGLRTAAFSAPAEEFASGIGLDEVRGYGLGLGTGVAMLGVEAEVVSQIAHIIRDRVPEHTLLLGGCLDSPIGYVPTRQMVSQGGYEGHGFLEHFGLQAVAPSAAENLLARLLQLREDLESDPGTNS